MPAKSNGSHHVDEAIALMVQNQAALLAEQTSFVAEPRDTNRSAEAAQRNFEGALKVAIPARTRQLLQED